MAYEAGGRSAQKGRTREALVSAARDLVAAGVTPTVEAAAAAASVSRSTAYRYFPNKRALLLAAHPEVAAESMLPPDAPDDPAGAARRGGPQLHRDDRRHRGAAAHDAALSLEADANERGELPLRQGRAIGWITEALDGLRGELSEHALRRLVLSIRATIGIEALVWLVDVGGLSREEAVELMRDSAQALLQTARL